MEERKRARKLNFKKRAWALTTDENVKMRKLRRLVDVSILKAKHSDDGSSEYYQQLAWTAYRAYLGVKYMCIFGSKIHANTCSAEVHRRETRIGLLR